MANSTKATEPTHELQDDARLDEHAQNIFRHLGFVGRLPDDLYEAYKTFKGQLDALSPGRQPTFDGFAAVVTIWRTQRASQRVKGK